MRIISFLLIGLFASIFTLSGCSSANKGTSAADKHNAKVWQKQQSDKAHKDLDKY